MNQDDRDAWDDLYRDQAELQRIMTRHGMARTLLYMAQACETIATEHERAYSDSCAAEEWRQCADEMHGIVRRWREGAGF